MFRAPSMLVLALAGACEQSPAAPPDAGADVLRPSDRVVAADQPPAPVDAATDPCTQRGVEVVQFATSDGVMLEADLHVPEARSGRGVVLLHMVPPGNTRNNYTDDFIGLLTARGFVVLNVDRRGAGGSEGVAQEAYFGPGGALDVAAARTFLAAHVCGPRASAIAVVGASNGTTSMVDDAVANGPPAAMVFLTGGTYTDAQNRVAANLPRLGAAPALFVYAQNERAWSVARMSAAPARWEFQEYTPGGHGTVMLTNTAASQTLVADFLRRVVVAAPR